MRISDWSSDVCSSDLDARRAAAGARGDRGRGRRARGDERLHRIAQGELFERGRSLFGHRELHYEGRAGRGDRRAADRRKSVRRLGQLRKGDRKSVVDGQSVSVRVELGGGRYIKQKKQ